MLNSSQREEAMRRHIAGNPNPKQVRLSSAVLEIEHAGGRLALTPDHVLW